MARGSAPGLVRELEGGAVPAANVTVESIDGGMRVEADIPGPRVNQAQSVAAAHGFQLAGKAGEGRYAFESYSTGGGLDLPGGVL